MAWRLIGMGNKRDRNRNAKSYWWVRKYEEEKEERYAKNRNAEWGAC